MVVRTESGVSVRPRVVCKASVTVALAMKVDDDYDDDDGDDVMVVVRQ
jgi:hypothetical protein